MFNEDADWSDEEETRSLSKTPTTDSQKTNNNSKTKQSKVVGRKSLMRTLQTLGSVPEWKSEDQHRNSDSDGDATQSPSKKKRKKKRSRKRKHAEASEEHQENGGADEPVEEEETGAKKQQKKNADRKPLKALKKSPSDPKEKKIPSPAQGDGNSSASTGRLSRQQWKTKMKNKKRCKNKYRQEKPGEEVTGAAENQEANQGFKPDLNGSGDSRESKKKKREKQQMESDSKGMKSADRQNDVTEQPTKQKGQPSREQSLKREKLRKLLQMPETEQHEVPTEQKDKQEDLELEVEEKERQTDSTSFRSRMEQRLESARFRYINEVLYTTSSGEAKRMFGQDPQAFWVYHKGYTAQVQRWPSNPVDAIISFIRQKPASLVIADFGCGDCKIARSVKNKVHSFDLAATCDLVTVCDMAHVPLKDSSVDIAVFCLSLMGTNLAEFLAEANRVLRKDGVLKVAEVASRFENVRDFITALSQLGFKLVSKDTEKSHFYSFEFVKTGNTGDKVKKFRVQLKPCVYKKR